jgi:Transposase DDE domain
MRQTKKSQYRVRNWREYNAALVQRGSLEVWIDKAVLASWQVAQKTGERGCPQVYQDMYIEMLLILGMAYKLSLRGTEGFARSVLAGLDLHIAVPNYSTLSRRRKALQVKVSTRDLKGARVITVDSSGLKVYGEGEWKVRQHGVSKRRTWRKFHVAVDTETNEILNLEGSTNAVSDDEMTEAVLDGIDPEMEIKQVCADGSYDKKRSYQAIAKRKATATIPPRKDAKIIQHGNSNAPPLDRDQNLRRIRQIGRKRWKQEAGYHQRSKAETAIYRYKTIVGDKLASRLLESQFVEMKLGAKVLNKMSALGMPQSYPLPA